MQPREVTSGTTPRPPPHTTEKNEEYYDNGPVPVEVPGQQAEAEGAVAVRQVDEDIVPDGGLLAWLQVVGSWLLFFNSWYAHSHLPTVEIFCLVVGCTKSATIH